MENNHLPNPFLPTATRIGDQLCETAFRDHKKRLCNWMGRQDIMDPLLANFSTRSAALGPDLYGGSTGIALFLYELHRQTNIAKFAETALAAYRRGLHYLRNNSIPASPLSFFAGHLGLAYLGSRLSDGNRDQELQDDLHWLTGEIINSAAEPHTLDVISGNAGAIPILMQLSRDPGLAELEKLAVTLGDELCDAAEWNGSTCSWGSSKASGDYFKNPPMTGFSHGASGFSYSLLQIYACTGNEKFLKFARGGFAYEDSLYSNIDGNWVDTRSPYSNQNGRINGKFQTAWCHGAPGITLARIEAAKLDPEYAEEHQKWAMIGVQTTISALKRNLELPGYDVTLCHGLSGLSEIILTYGYASKTSSAVELSAQTALDLIQRHGESGNWPSGVNAGGPNPSLMIGTAGLGYHLLRLHDPKKIPSILALMAL